MNYFETRCCNIDILKGVRRLLNQPNPVCKKATREKMKGVTRRILCWGGLRQFLILWRIA
ncbi:MAG: hypothetical protein A2W61_07190 [Deltaproteobacteria bacterium RIFCSPLOWO2_01_44_7]|nr:MAG: hypothetical protein A2712_07420 [Deltaproteobacteria bacterium RIFCSPHIGHO2_01_FULL_43_49]OGQ15772.1 MAG: hypothetical protein A3D22_06210 [Deltaproteobacteria bacterium RIFCSPHIGHO2_02_FULL_44_53]OGQ28916.1 MAG: hypothetical protein A3D98_01405 [Deltaproteobacteria bacterium RIFCSPHIGHO2_12_FULL_44_21]OGQ32065.1 MAG: hypothetical protein A2979_03155 [Deltaproteobacteria bacterium RIFCSPLOWO2_01_FULL_45_74]OGQ40646.1 MAG: hypothetical protein A2W61_07190 [Deltaproteobacteria bacterium 